MHNEKESAELPQSCNLFVVSRYLDNWYRSRLPSANIQIIANGVDTSIFQPKWFGKEAPPPLSKIDSSVFSAKKVIMYVGRMSPEKGPLKLARAFGELLQQRKDLFLLLVGEFSTGEGDRAKYSQAIRAQCALYADHCQLIDVIPPEHVHHVYSQADMLIIPSEFEEPFGMVCIEAMASGVPVLAPKRGGLLELINEPDYGYHIREPNNPTLFAKQISELIDMKDELQNTAKKAHLHVKNFYDWTHVAEQTECAYSNLVSEVMKVGGIAYSVVCKS